MNNLSINCSSNVNFCARPVKLGTKTQSKKILTFEQGAKDFEKMEYKPWLEKYKSCKKTLLDLLVKGYKNEKGFIATRLEAIPPFDIISIFKDSKDTKKLFGRDSIIDRMYKDEGKYMRGDKSIIEELAEKSPNALDSALFEQNVRTGKIPLHVFVEDNKLEFIESLNRAYKKPNRLEKLADMYTLKDDSKNVDYPLKYLPEITPYQKQKLVGDIKTTFNDRPDLLKKVLKTME